MVKDRYTVTRSDKRSQLILTMRIMDEVSTKTPKLLKCNRKRFENLVTDRVPLPIYSQAKFFIWGFRRISEFHPQSVWNPLNTLVIYVCRACITD